MLRSRSAFRSYLRALRSQYGVALCPSMASTTRTVNIPIAIVVDKPTTKIKRSCTYITSKATVVLLIASPVLRGRSRVLACNSDPALVVPPYLVPGLRKVRRRGRLAGCLFRSL